MSSDDAPLPADVSSSSEMVGSDRPLNEVVRRVIDRANARRRGEVVEEPKMPEEEWVEVGVEEVKYCTAKAVLVILQSSLEEQWIPKSQIKGESPVATECDLTIQVSRWFAEKEGLVEEDSDAAPD